MPRLANHMGGWRRTPAHLRPPTANHAGLTILPEVDPRGQLPPVFNQWQLGSCTANAATACFQYDTIVDGRDCGPLSRLFVYYQERKLEGELGQGDTGAIGSDAFKVASAVGVCAEADWPYDISTFQGPAPIATAHRRYWLTKPYHAVTPTVDAAKAVLSNRQTIAFGFTVYASFESPAVAASGVVPMPDPARERVLGGHEVLLVGYLKDHPEHGLVRNSWGPGWGMAGYCLMPWAMILNATLAGDHTTIVRPAC